MQGDVNSRDGRDAPRAAFADAVALARQLLAEAPRRSALATGLLLIATVTEALGVVTIVPLLHVAGIGGERPAPGPLGAAVGRAAETLGVELTLPLVLGAFLALGATRSVAVWQRDMQFAALRFDFEVGLRHRLYAAAAAAAWPRLVRQRRSDLVHVLANEVLRAGAGAQRLLQLAVAAAAVLAQFTVALVVSPFVAFAALLAGGALLLAGRPLLRRSEALGRRMTGAGRALHAGVAEFLGGLKLAKSANAEARYVEDFTRHLRELRRRQIGTVATAATARAIFDGGAAAVLAVLVWVAVRHAGLTPSELVVVAFVFARVTLAARAIPEHLQGLAADLAAWRHASAQERDLRGEAEADGAPGLPPLPLERELTVRGVSFAYDAAPGRPALADVDLTIPAGALVAITGPSGAGKTTLADLLLGLLAPHAGEILVDGAPLAGGGRRRWRRAVGYAPQESYLLHDTIRANLLWARPDAPEADLWRALRLAAADRFVAALPHGLDTVAEDRGARFSGGERQRLALARTLLGEPALLVLDEATSQLDAGTERSVLAGIRSLAGRTTVVAVTHRPALMEIADLVVVLEAGRVTAAGAWSALAPAVAAAAVPGDPQPAAPAVAAGGRPGL